MIKIFLFIVVTGVILFADCKITKDTYIVKRGNTTCTYTVFWKEGYVGDVYRASTYNIRHSKECKSFPKPLKGKKIKEELIRKEIGSECAFDTHIKSNT